VVSRRELGGASQRRGVDAEAIARRALEADGWTILGQRLRTPEGEIDVVARREAMVAFIEVKLRPTLAGAAEALTARQSRRLFRAAEALLAARPDWAADSYRFDVLAVDAAGRVRRIADALRADS
jgi:putative endonuclease